MKKIYLVPAFIIMVLPFAASAHERAVYTINGSTYQFVVGSLNEPVAVDDKTGVDLTVTKGSASTPVAGLESTLKVELIAGDQKKTLPLAPVYGKAGSYSAAFYPTVATTIAYHFMGTIDNTPIDLTFTCIPEGAPKAADDTTAVQVSDSVTRISNTGGFGCPAPKEDLGFPESSASVSTLSGSLKSLGTASHSALALSFAALALAAIAFSRRR